MSAQIIFRSSSSIENRRMVSVRAVVLLFVFASTFLSVAEVRTAAVILAQCSPVLEASSPWQALSHQLPFSRHLSAGHSDTDRHICCAPTDPCLHLASAHAVSRCAPAGDPLCHVTADGLRHRLSVNARVADMLRCVLRARRLQLLKAPRPSQAARLAVPANSH